MEGKVLMKGKKEEDGVKKDGMRRWRAWRRKMVERMERRGEEEGGGG